MLQHHHATPSPPGRVVVIGAGGFIGGAVMRRLAQAGVEALPVSRREVDLLVDDAADRLTALLQPGDAVVAASAIAPCKNVAMLVQNLKLVQALTGVLSRADLAHVINISSDAVYGDELGPLSEAATAAPGSLHGVMHLARELAFQAEVTAPLAILRPTLVYGAADPHNGYGPNRFRRLAASGQEIVLFGEGEERRDHVAVEDVAEIVVRVLMHRSTGILNIATGDVHSFKEIAEIAVSLAPQAVPIKGTPRVGSMPHNGYRAFDPAATSVAFPDFSYTRLADGLRRAAAPIP